MIEKRLEQYGDVEYHASLSKHTTFRIGGACRYLVYPKSEIGFTQIIHILKEEQLPFKVLGKGSNILASDQDFDGAIICLDRYFNECSFEADGTCVAQAGCSIILAAHEAMKRSLSGLEFASGIPATIGGCVFMNAGAYRSDMSQVVTSIYVYRDGEMSWMSADEANFSYRHSIFQEHPDWIVLGVKFALDPGDQKEISDLMDSRRTRRLASQPLEYPCAGSIFRNPGAIPAWKLIEDIGMRGKQIGGALVSEKHANFIVNAGGAKASDVMELVEEIQRRVKAEYQIELKMEVERFNW